MIICIHEKSSLRIMAKNKPQSLNLIMPVGSYKNFFGWQLTKKWIVIIILLI